MKRYIPLIILCWLLCGGFLYIALTGRLELSAGGRLEHAQQLMARGLHEEAVGHLQATLQTTPDDAVAHMMLALVRLDQRHYSSALSAYRQALVHDPLIAQTALFSDMVEKAELADKQYNFLATYRRLAQEIAKPGPEHIAAYDLSARIALYNAAEQARTIGELLHMSFGADTLMLGDVIAGRFEGARTNIEQVPGDASKARQILDQMRRYEQLADEAFEYLRTAEKLAPADPALRLAMALYRLDRNDREASLAEILGIVKDTPAPRVNLLLLAARTLAAQGQPEEAAEYVARVREIEPDNFDARYIEAALKFQRGENESLKQEVEELRGRSFGDNRVMFLLGSLNLLEGSYSRAASDLAHARRDHQHWELLEYHLGLAELQNGNYVRAESILRGLTDWRTIFAEAHLAHAFAALRSRNFTHAERSCRRILERRPDDLDALRILAAVHLDRKDIARAADALKRYLAIAPEDDRALMALAAVRLANGEIEQVIADHQQAVSARPDAYTHHRILAFAYSLAGDSPLAQMHYAALQQQRDDAPEAAAYRARMLALAGQPHAAIEECRTALADGVALGPISAAMGTLNTITGHYSDARALLSHASRPPRETMFIIDLYFSLASHRDIARTATEILIADPFSKRSHDLLASVYAAGVRGGEIGEELDTLTREQPGIVSILNAAIVPRQTESIDGCREYLVNFPQFWPRLIHAHTRRGIDWP